MSGTADSETANDCSGAAEALFAVAHPHVLPQTGRAVLPELAKAPLLLSDAFEPASTQELELKLGKGAVSTHELELKLGKFR